MMNVLKIALMVVVLEVFSIMPVKAQVTKNNLDQNADQAQGNYAATNLNYLGSGSLGMMQSAWKDPLQHMGEGQSRPGYSKYYWTPELVLPVRLREGMYTLINFPAWEVIENVYLGDGQSFNAEIQGASSLMVYPEASKFVGVDTNMIVFGRSGNKYVFYVQSETINTDRITNAIIDIEVVKTKHNANGSAVISSGGAGGHINANSYAQDGSSIDATFTRNLQKEDWIEKIPVDPTKFRFDIEVYVPNPDDIIIAPERVWRDNIFTYIDLGEKALTAVQRPIVTLIVERSETPVGFRSAGPNNRLIIVEGMGDMVLRSGKRMVCLKLRRADSDGLENTVYAKTNEWDPQTAYASQPDGNGTNEPISYEDVYGSGSNTNTNAKQMPSGNNGDFFSPNSFSGSGTSVPSNRENTPQGQVSSQEKSSSLSINDAQSLDALPKAKTVVAVPDVPEKVSQENVETPKVTGQYDVQVGQAEVIAPDYNNQKVNVGVTYQPDRKDPGQIQEIKKSETPQLGNSENNSNPILIRPKEDLSTQKTLISPETEALLQEFRSGKALSNTNESDIFIVLGTDENVNNLEKLWSDISKRYTAILGKYQPFYSVDAPADGQGKDLFHLRVGPVDSIKEGDNVCSQLARNGIFCNVVRIQ